MTTGAPNQGEYFRNRQEAHNWLQDNGYKVSIGKFYQDIKRQGFPVLNADGTVSKYQVAVYGKALETPSTPDPSALSRHEYVHRKEKAEAEMAEMKARKMEREEDELWLHAPVAWSVIAALVGSLRDVVRRHLHDAQADIARAGGGDLGRSPEVFEHIDQVVARAFNEVAGAPIDVQWGEEE